MPDMITALPIGPVGMSHHVTGTSFMCNDWHDGVGNHVQGGRLGDARSGAGQPPWPALPIGPTRTGVPEPSVTGRAGPLAGRR